ARLVPRLARVAVISGRPVSFLADALGLAGVVYVGVYGLERLVDGEVVVDERVGPWVDAVARAADEAAAALPGLFVGRRGAFAALRDLERSGVLRHAVTIGVASVESPPEVHDADVVVEGPGGLAAVLHTLADELSGPG